MIHKYFLWITSDGHVCELFRGGVRRRLLRQQPPGLHITRTGFLRGLGLSLGGFLQSLGDDADLNCIRDGSLRFHYRLRLRWCWRTRGGQLNCSRGLNVRRTSYWTDHYENLLNVLIGTGTFRLYLRIWEQCGRPLTRFW